MRPDTWTVDFHRNARRFHLSRPDSTDRQLRVSVHADSGAHTEVLTFDFPEVATGTTTLRLRWGTMVVPLHIGMTAPPLTMVAKDGRRRFVGRYDVEVFIVSGRATGFEMRIEDGTQVSRGTRVR